MPLFNGWNIITMPTTPPAPASVEFSVNDAVAMSMSPFTGEQQTQNWGPLPMEATLALPPLTQAQSEAWITFLRAMNGVANVTQFGAAFAAQYASSIGNRYWRLKKNLRKWSISEARVFGIQLEFIEAK
jgi:hypothetical protein